MSSSTSNSLRSLKSILPAFKVNMGGIILDQALPHQGTDQVNPFLLVHHLEHTYPAGSAQQDVGVPPHPHRGFAPVTFVFKGGVHHRDSLDKSSVVYAGGTQWMHAGRGIVHSERPAKEVAAKGETWELIQFWVNAPAAFKMNEPFYHPLQKEDTPTVYIDEGKVEVGVVAGSFYQTLGPVKTYTPIQALRFNFEAGGEAKIPVPQSHNAFVYLLDGAMNLNGKNALQAKDLAWLENDGDTITLRAEQKTRAILLAGEPIEEPLATYGPFVMNSQAEIMQAMRDYQTGKMGVLEEKFD